MTPRRPPRPAGGAGGGGGGEDGDGGTDGDDRRPRVGDLNGDGIPDIAPGGAVRHSSFGDRRAWRRHGHAHLVSSPRARRWCSPTSCSRTHRVTAVGCASGAAPAGPILFEIGLQNFRDLDYHFVSPVRFATGEDPVLEVVCAAAGPPAAQPCSAAAYLGGTIGGLIRALGSDAAR